MAAPRSCTPTPRTGWRARAGGPRWPANPLLGALASLALLACGEPNEAPPAGERAGSPPPQDAFERRRALGRSVHDELARAMAEPRDPADGGGRAWLELPPGEDGAARVGAAGSWRIVYEAGPLGVAEGGAVYLQVSPFWGWSTPQPDDPGAPGYTEVATSAKVVLEPQTIDENLMAIHVREGALAAGEQVRIHFGAGALGARADSFAERASRFWIAVDGDGDGLRAVLADSPCVPVLPGPPARLVLTGPSTARAGDELRIALAVLDRGANAWPEFSGTVELLDLPEGMGLPASVELAPEDRAQATLSARAPAPGVYRLRARVSLGGEVVEAWSNPLLVSDGPRIVWADLHGHSDVSDGTARPDDYFRYARDVARLDAVALTDHDHWGLLPLDEHPELWAESLAAGERFHEPGRFVTLHGFEWTNWVYGHRHVLYFSDEAPLLSSLDERYDEPAELWAALRGLPALTVPHHPAGGPAPIDWSVAPDGELEPAVEVTSAHGCSEALDCARSIYSPLEGCFARDALGRGYRLAFVGGGDGHDGHPGFTHLGPHYPTGGVGAVLTEELSREGLLAALRAGRAYATSGPRIVLRTALGGARMGTAVAAAELGAAATLYVEVHGTAPIESIEVVRSGTLYAGLSGEGALDLTASAELSELAAGEYVYVRVVQADGGAAWSSPVFVE